MGEVEPMMIDVEASNALKLFEGKIRPMMEKGDKKIILLLDYDGTLAPMVKNPALAVIPEKTLESVRRVSKKYTTGIVSGRSVEKIEGFLGDAADCLYIAGSHGFDIRGPVVGPGATVEYKASESSRDSLIAIRDICTERFADIEGSEVEDNVYSVSVHYRKVVDQEKAQLMIAQVTKLVDEMEELRLTHGKMVLEIRPNHEWHKGKAAMYILTQLPHEMDDMVVFYIGDDTTDEDVFRAFRESDDVDGMGIVVTDKTRATFADFSLRSTEEVQQFLEVLHKYGEDRGLEA